MNSYTTKQGDMWDSISKKIYGNEAGMTKLLEANKEYSGLVIFPAGITLNIPAWEAPKAETLPPWRR